MDHLPPIRIVALLRDDALSRLRLSLDSTCKFEAVATVSQLDEGVKARRADALVVDPACVREDLVAPLITTVADSGLPTLVYTRLEHISCSRALQLIGQIAAEFVAFGAEDEPARLRFLVRRLAQPTVPARMLHRMSRRWRALPSPLREGVTGLFAWKQVPGSVHQFARRMNLDANGVRRWLGRAGLAGPSRTLKVARLSRALELLQDRETSIGAVAQAAGFARLRTFEHEFRKFLQTTPSRVRGSVDRVGFAEQLTTALRASHDPSERESTE